MNKLSHKNEILRYGSFGLIILVTWLLQNTASTWLAPSNLTLYLIVSIVVAIAMVEDPFPASLFGLFAGLLLDLFVPGPLGYSSLMLLLLALGTSLCVERFMRSTILTNILFNAVAITLYLFFYWFFLFALKGTVGSAAALFTIYLPRGILTLLLSPLFYILIRKVRKCFL